MGVREASIWAREETEGTTEETTMAPGTTRTERGIREKIETKIETKKKMSAKISQTEVTIEEEVIKGAPEEVHTEATTTEVGVATGVIITRITRSINNHILRINSTMLHLTKARRPST